MTIINFLPSMKDELFRLNLDYVAVCPAYLEVKPEYVNALCAFLRDYKITGRYSNTGKGTYRFAVNDGTFGLDENNRVILSVSMPTGEIQYRVNTGLTKEERREK